MHIGIYNIGLQCAVCTHIWYILKAYIHSYTADMVAVRNKSKKKSIQSFVPSSVGNKIWEWSCGKRSWHETEKCYNCFSRGFAAAREFHFLKFLHCCRTLSLFSLCLQVFVIRAVLPFIRFLLRIQIRSGQRLWFNWNLFVNLFEWPTQNTRSCKRLRIFRTIVLIYLYIYILHQIPIYFTIIMCNLGYRIRTQMTTANSHLMHIAHTKTRLPFNQLLSNVYSHFLPFTELFSNGTTHSVRLHCINYKCFVVCFFALFMVLSKRTTVEFVVCKIKWNESQKKKRQVFDSLLR